MHSIEKAIKSTVVMTVCVVVLPITYLICAIKATVTAVITGFCVVNCLLHKMVRSRKLISRLAFIRQSKQNGSLESIGSARSNEDAARLAGQGQVSAR